MDIPELSFHQCDEHGAAEVRNDYASHEIQALPPTTLARAAKNYPGKPIFVFSHVPPANTVLWFLSK